MTFPEYRAHLANWRAYLDMTDNDRTLLLMSHLAPPWHQGFHSWPTTWGPVECAFGTRERFDEAMACARGKLGREAAKR